MQNILCFSRRMNFLAALLIACAPGIAQAETVGTAGAINPRSAGSIESRPPKLIEIGEQVVRDEKIETSPTGSVQIVFIDRTTLNIGPNSAIVIDRFVYNPATSTGTMALTLGRGVLRIVGGQVTHTGGATIGTPVATIGVRGGIATISHCEEGTGCHPAGTFAINHFGVITVSAGGVTQEILRPGFGIRVANERGATPSAPRRMAQSEIDSANALLTSRGSQRGGSKRRPTDVLAAASGLGHANRKITPMTAARQRQTHATTLVSASASSDIASSVASTVQQGVAQATVAATTVPAAAYALTTTAGAGSNVPFLTASFATSGPVNISPVYGYRAAVPSSGPADVVSTGGSLNSLQQSFPSRMFQASLAIDGVGAAQTSTLSVMTGAMAGLSQPGQRSLGFVQGGTFSAIARTKSFTYPLFATGEVGSTTNTPSAPSPITTSATGLPTAPFSISQNYPGFDPTTGKLIAVPAMAIDDAIGPYSYNQTLSPLTTPVGLGTHHPNLVLNGYVGAIGQSLSGTVLPAYIVTNQTGTPGDVSISLYGNSSSMSAEFDIKDATPTDAPGGLQTAKLRFGSPPNTTTTTYQGTQGTYVDVSHFAALQQLANTPGGQVNTSTINGTGVAESSMMLVNAAAVNATSFFPSVTFCPCDYTQWGLWSALAAGSNLAASSTGIGFWVAGLPAAQSDVNSAIANNAMATYTGHVIAAIANGPNNPSKSQFPSQYIAASNFTDVVNFGTRRGSINIPSLDGASYTGAVSLASNPTLFAGTLSSSVCGRTMSLNGSFFQGTASSFSEMGGNVTVNGTNYLASGIFAAARKQ